MKTHPNDPITTDSQFAGLTKREHFAGIVMQGLLANSNADVCDSITVNNGWHHPDTIARIAVQMADALIGELNRKEV